MTDNPTPVSTAEVPPIARQSNTVGLVALILAGAGFLLGVIPPTSGLAWLLTAPALVLAIIGLTRKGKKGTSIAALILAIVGWIVAIIVATTTFVAGVGQAIDEADDAPNSASETETGAGDAPAEAAIGDTVTNDAGVAFTVSAVTCGLATAGEEFLSETASGQFCEVRFTILNGSNAAVSIYSTDVTGYIGDAEYEANGTVSRFGDDYFTTEVNPGLSVDSVIYIDIPTDAALEYIKYEPLFSFVGGLIIRVS